jgi:hypothetical protein
MERPGTWEAATSDCRTGGTLDLRDRPGRPPLRFETADAGRLALWQNERLLLLAREQEGGCSREGLYVHRLPGYRSPLPPITATLARRPGNWPLRYARWLENTGEGPLHEGRWHLGERKAFPPYVWQTDFERDWPGCHLAWCADGWQGVVPLRPLSPPDAPRVKAYRRQAREGTLAPVLLWRATPLDGWLLLDGHDRAVAALLEDRTPPCVVLARLADEREWRREARNLTEAWQEYGAPITEMTDMTEMAERHADVLASLPYEDAPTRTWPLPGGRAAWDDLAPRSMLQCPRD